MPHASDRSTGEAGSPRSRSGELDSAPDVLRPVLLRCGDLRSGQSRICYVHAPAGLGAGQLVRTWLHERDLWSDVTWRNLTATSGPASTGDRPTPLLVIKGATDGPGALGIASLLRRHDHLIVIGSGSPEEWRAEWNAEVYPAEMLRLTRMELADVAMKRGIHMGLELLAELEEATAGWPTLVDLVLGAYAQGDRLTDLGLGLEETRPHVTGRLLRFLDDRQRALVRLLAVAHELTNKEVESLAALQTAGDLRKMGVVLTDSVDGPSYRLPTVIATAVAADLQPNVTRNLLVKLAEQRLRLEIRDRGLEFAYRAAAWQLASRIIDRWGLEIGFSRSARLQQQVIWEIPRDALTRSLGAWHRAEYAGALPLGRAPAPIPAGTDCRRLIDQGMAPTVLKRSLMATVARRVHKRYADALDMVRQAQELAGLTIRPRHPRIAGATAHWFLQAGISHELAGDLDEAIELYRLGWQARLHDQTGVAGVDIAGKLAARLAWRGDTAEAIDWAGEMPDHLDPDRWYTPHVLSGFQQAAAILATDRLDQEAAESWVVALRRPTTVDEYWAWRLAADVHYLITWDEAQRALDAVSAARSRYADFIAADGHHGEIVDWLEAEAALALGLGERVQQGVNGLGQSPFASPVAARLALVSGDAVGARVLAESALRGSLTRRSRTQLQLVLAVALQQAGEEPMADALLTRVVTHARVARDVRVLCTVPREPLERCADRSAGLYELLEQLDRAGGVPLQPAHIELVSLTDRERAVLERLVRGLSLRETADELVVSVNTVKTQTRSLYKALGVSDRASLVSKARHLKLTDP